MSTETDRAPVAVARVKSASRVVVRAHAKINLDLRVLGRMPDGYHELRTVFQALALHDTLTVTRTRGPFTLTGAGEAMPLDRTNLVWRAADALWRAAGRSGDPRGARVHVEKRIPAQAGLGGGSSNAAAALRGLCRVWGLRLAPRDLARLAAGIGADVPFFLVGGTALGLGRGDRLFPLPDLPRRTVVIARPAFGVSTAEAYAWLASERAGQPVCPAGAPDWLDLSVSLAGCVNDLEPAVERRHPGIAAVRDVLAGAGAELARMSGSGSAVFGLFRSRAAATRAVRELRRRGVAALLTATAPAGRTPAL
ncbi:MAG TPA: 4-(cytidine 5'-diphospho)-2-C-methyl-D-erythritol kinase [Vicinamibacterales bacterium]